MRRRRSCWHLWRSRWPYLPLAPWASCSVGGAHVRPWKPEVRRHLLRFAIASLIVIGGLGVGAETSSAHSRFVRSDPESGATLETAPTTVRVTFSEEPVASLSE